MVGPPLQQTGRPAVGPHEQPATKASGVMGSSREEGSRNRETACHHWGLGPQIGDRWRKYRGRFRRVLGCSYKGSIPALPRPAQGFTEQKESSRLAFFWPCRYYLMTKIQPVIVSEFPGWPGPAECPQKQLSNPAWAQAAQPIQPVPDRGCTRADHPPPGGRSDGGSP